MNAKVFLNLGLIATLLALSLFMYYRAGHDVTPEMRITTLKRDDVSRIVIEPRGAPPIKLERHDGAWRLVAPLTASAEMTQVDRLVDIVNANAKQKLANPDLAQLDLVTPPVRVTLNDQVVAFGRINDITYEQYVEIAGNVYVVPPLYGYGIPTDVTKLLGRRLLDANEIPVAFDFGGYKIVRDEKGTWTATGDFPVAKETPLSQDDFNRWADEWRHTSALSVAPDKGEKGGHATAQVVVKFQDGKSVTMEILQREPDFQLLREDSAMRFHFGAEVGRRLTDPRVVAKK